MEITQGLDHGDASSSFGIGHCQLCVTSNHAPSWAIMGRCRVSFCCSVSVVTGMLVDDSLQSVYRVSKENILHDTACIYLALVVWNPAGNFRSPAGLVISCHELVRTLTGWLSFACVYITGAALNSEAHLKVHTSACRRVRYAGGRHDSHRNPSDKCIICPSFSPASRFTRGVNKCRHGHKRKTGRKREGYIYIYLI
jgi:hypothetical protein